MKVQLQHPAKERRMQKKMQKQARHLEQKRQEQEVHRRRRRCIRFILWCVIMLAVAAVPAAFMNTVFGYLPVIAVAVLILFSWIYMKILKRVFQFEEVSDFKNCRRGEHSDFKVHIKNRSVFVFPRLEASFYISDIFGGEGSLKSSVITLAPKEDRDFRFDVNFQHIGIYEAGLKRVTIYDLLGLFSNTLDNEKQYQIRVAPKLFDAAKLKVSNATFVESRDMKIPISVEGMDYTGVREYVRGDPIKSIHWKLSARTEHYMTRQYESYGNTGMSIIMDFQTPNYDTESLMSIFDGIVETALSLELHAQKSGVDCEIKYVNKDGKRKRYISKHSKDSFDLILDLPAVSPDPGKYRAEDILREEMASVYGQANIAFVTSRADSELCRMLQEAKYRRKYPMLFVIVPPACFGEERKEFLKPLRILNMARIPFYVLETAEELQGGERRNVS